MPQGVLPELRMQRYTFFYTDTNLFRILLKKESHPSQTAPLNHNESCIFCFKNAFQIVFETTVNSFSSPSVSTSTGR
jgi:hypothetical protein